MKALIVKQDSLARRSARAIQSILHGTISTSELVRDHDAWTTIMRRRFARVPAELTPMIMAARSGGEFAVRRVMDQHLRAVLSELADRAEALPTVVSRRCGALSVPSTLKASTNLPAARARAARLSAALTDLRARAERPPRRMGGR